MTENVLKAMFFLVLFATLMVSLLFPDHRQGETARDNSLDAGRQERFEISRNVANNNPLLRIVPAVVRNTRR
jgi:hypothetical protein